MTESYVPIDELAKHLNVKPTTIRSWVQKGYISKDSYIKVGYTYRFNIPAVIAGLKKEKLEEYIPKDIEYELLSGNTSGISLDQLDLDLDSDEDDDL